jgi:polysaccharide biosynthesis protein PslG
MEIAHTLRFRWMLFASLVALHAAFVPAHAAPHPSLPPIGSLEGLGVNIHFTDPQPGELEMIAAAGFQWVRMDLTWSGTERRKGEYDFSAYDRLVAALEKHGLRALFILDYGNPLYADPGDRHPFTSRAATPEFREAYGKWAVAAVSRFRGKGYLWELWNEPNHAGFWKPKPHAPDYIALAKTACEALRAAGLTAESTEPTEKEKEAESPRVLRGSRSAGEAIIGPATSTIDLPFLEACFQGGLLEHWCAVSVHPYRQTAPETAEEEYRKLRLLIRRYAPKGKAIPILSGEWGYSTAWPSLGKDEAACEEQQAKYLARQFLTNVANDIPLTIWYDWRDDGDDPREAEHRFGIVRRKYHEGRDPVFDPKPAYVAAKTLTTQLAGFRFNKRIAGWPELEMPSPFYCLFTQGDAARLAAWTVGRWGTRVSCPLERGALRRWNYLGVAGKDVAADEKAINVGIDTAPTYFVPVVPGPVWRLISAWERIPSEYTLESPGRVSIEARFSNPLAEPVGVNAWGTLDGRWAEGDISYSIMITEPRAVLQPQERGPLRVEEPVSGREPRKSFEFWAAFWLGKEKLCEVCQPVRLTVSNPLDARLLPPEAETLPVAVSDPSGKGFEGEVWLRGRLKRQARYGLKIPPGQTAAVARMSLADIESAELDGSPPILALRIDSMDGKPVFDRRVGFPSRCAPQLLLAAKALADGAPETKSQQQLSEAQPAGAPSPGGNPVVKLKYAMSVGWKFIRVTPPGDAERKIGEFAREFGLWLHGDGHGCIPRIRFVDATGQIFQSDGPRIDWKGWRYVTFPMQATEENELHHWGGANDGVIHYPIKWDTLFLLDNAERKAIEGEVFLSAPTLIY